ncbi:MAG: M23 family metallopeptidase [Bacteroidetes bacterium]|nr:M23 family metallopeptidase [Bacteroidota bacterium]
MSNDTNKAKRNFRDFLRNKYRLILLNDNTFGESFSLRLSPMSLLIAGGAVTIVMTIVVISTVAFTPLREYIPGYGDVGERKQIMELNVRADSLEEALQVREIYIQSIKDVLEGNLETKTDRPKHDTTGITEKINTKPGKAVTTFKEEYENNKGNFKSDVVKLSQLGLGELVFFTPAQGLVSNSFNSNEEHFGVDIVTKPNESIKSTLDGTVIFSGFSAQDGYVIQIQHNNNLISMYKHCATLLKNQGERVKSGEAIAIVGNTGERSKGAHLHFELWFNGAPVNPQEFVAF